MFDGRAGPIRPQDHRVIYQTLANTPSGVAALIEFLTGQWNRTLNDVVNGEQVVTSMYALLASKVAGDDEIDKVHFVAYEEGQGVIGIDLPSRECFCCLLIHSL